MVKQELLGIEQRPQEALKTFAWVCLFQHELLRRLHFGVIRRAAYGAITHFNLHTDLAMGHLLLKAILLLVDAGEDRMTQVAAYYIWQNTRAGSNGHDVADWLQAEDAVLKQLSGHHAD